MAMDTGGMGGGGQPSGFTPWSNMAPSAPKPSDTGTKRDFADMLNQQSRVRKPREMQAHFELPKKLKLNGF